MFTSRPTKSRRTMIISLCLPLSLSLDVSLSLPGNIRPTYRRIGSCPLCSGFRELRVDILPEGCKLQLSQPSLSPCSDCWSRVNLLDVYVCGNSRPSTQARQADADCIHVPFVRPVEQVKRARMSKALLKAARFRVGILEHLQDTEKKVGHSKGLDSKTRRGKAGGCNASNRQSINRL